MNKLYYQSFPELGFASDFRLVGFPDDYLTQNQEIIDSARTQMQELESGAVANPDEGRMVGHYWLRKPELSPSPDIAKDIRTTLERVKQCAARVKEGKLCSPSGPFTDLLVIGIGGSALGPQFVGKALAKSSGDDLRAHFFDNTDPDGIDFTLSQIGERLATTLVLVISKSGGTPETRNGMIEAKHAFEQCGLDFSKQAIAVTGDGSKLYETAQQENWLDFFPMWDWVGGRTSETAAVGMLPAALQGFDIDQLLDGAARMDELTRSAETLGNPAMMLALSWFYLSKGKGEKDMVILPYKDRLELFAKYLQQLIMESLGKERDLHGNLVNQGIAVYGNKGSTDQHAYVQQLREGIPNFFATFIEVLKHRQGPSIEVDEEGMNSGDYLHGFFLGTRDALREKERHSITLTVKEVNAFSVGMLIALYERAVGYYATMIQINAYHQPGVEAGKKAAAKVLTVRKEIRAWMLAHPDSPVSASDLAQHLGMPEQSDWVFKILESLSANDPTSFIREGSGHPLDDLFSSPNSPR
ncbi:MAG: glucose-6-phosphate isomerase [Opitutae bacterium]